MRADPTLSRMPYDLRWLLAASLALVIGMSGAESYARLAAPYYATVARIIARGHPWSISRVEVANDERSHGSVLRLMGEVRAANDDPGPAAMIRARLQVGAVIQIPILFWTLLLAWPTPTIARRVALLAVGLPVFLGLEAATTVCQLLNPLAYASAVLAGTPNPVTLWEGWSRFIESGGRFVLALCAALITIAAVSRSRRAAAAQ